MNVLPRDKQIAAISALTEGVSIRATERLTGIHRDTVMRLGVRVGEGCEALHDAIMRGLEVSRLEFDELWSFVGKKQKRSGDDRETGDQYTFIGLDANRKAIVSYRTGKRDGGTTQEFVDDLSARIISRPVINTDGFLHYAPAIENAFGAECDYGQIVKHYDPKRGAEASRRYAPGDVVAVSKRVVNGAPMKISTSFVERSNLTVRMQSRRFTRLTNGFSKKLRNHRAAVSLYVAHYNFCRPHETLQGITPAMAIGVTDHIWTIDELIDAADNPEGMAPTGRRHGKFTVIDGGLS